MKSHNHALDMRETYRGPDLMLLVRDLRDHQRKRQLTVKTWSTIKDVKDAISSLLHIPPHLQRLYYGPLLSLPNHRSLQDAGIYRSGETLLLDIAKPPSQQPHYPDSQQQQPSISIVPSLLDQTPKRLLSLIHRSHRGMALGYKPKPTPDGSGGTYFLEAPPHNLRVGVFKPADEEPYAPHNPRGYTGPGGALRDGIKPGEACLREVAAYLLDHKGFASVPMTTLVEAWHPGFAFRGGDGQNRTSVGNHSLSPVCTQTATRKKIGSFQAFLKSECSMDDISPSKISADQVHKIAVLDIRLMNADRNAANLLVRRKPDNSLELIPIDHGFSLRSACDVSWMDWCWLDWPQLRQPLSPKTKQYVLALDIERDVRLLKETLNLPPRALEYFRASNKLLQEGVRCGLTLYEIATLCCRNDDLGEVPSKLEILTEIVSHAALHNGQLSHAATGSAAFAEQLRPRQPPEPQEWGPMKTMDWEQEELPGMTRSSTASDASSDPEDEVVVVEQWAAAAVADAGGEMKRDYEIGKEEEDDSSDDDASSPEGFWHVHPGDHSDETDHDETVVWSPQVSPQPSPKRSKPSYEKLSVTFADILGDSEEDEAGFVLPASLGQIRPPAKSSGMKRSQSLGTFLSSETSLGGTAGGEDREDAWVTYFNKFVDLVIRKETKDGAKDRK